ncbi:hypothetical protein MMC17_010133 [Xylographa soralifera]|nr:hypothetical protein [Xylographa soralifera]
MDTICLLGRDLVALHDLAKVTLNTSSDVTKTVLQELAVYRRWFNDAILHANAETGSSAIIICPCGVGEPKFRDEQKKPPGPVPAYSMNYIASMIGLPQLITPIGQFPFDSRVSGRKEYLPVTGTIVGAKGSDLMLFNLAKAALEKANWPTKVATGRYAFDLGDGVRNVAKLDETTEADLTGADLAPSQIYPDLTPDGCRLSAALPPVSRESGDPHHLQPAYVHYTLAFKTTDNITAFIGKLVTMQDTWDTSWTNHEREFRMDQDRFYKRSFRPSKYQIDWRNEPYIPPLGPERVANEAACLRFIREKTDIPVPDVLEAYDDNGAFVLVTRRLRGVEMGELSPEQQAIVMVQVEEHIKVLQSLRSTRVGGPTGIICPPIRGTQYFPRDTTWSPWVSTKDDLIFCHCDLSQSNIIVDPENLKIEGIIDWEYGGFWPEYFETPFYCDPRPSGAQFRRDSENKLVREFILNLKASEDHNLNNQNESS